MDTTAVKPEAALPLLLRPEEAARELGISRAYLYEICSKGEGPAHIRFGNRMRFPLEDLLDFIAARKAS